MVRRSCVNSITSTPYPQLVDVFSPSIAQALDLSNPSPQVKAQDHNELFPDGYNHRDESNRFLPSYGYFVHVVMSNIGQVYSKPLSVGMGKNTKSDKI
jgi:hypothetical protein